LAWTQAPTSGDGGALQIGQGDVGRVEPSLGLEAHLAGGPFIGLGQAAQVAALADPAQTAWISTPSPKWPTPASSRSKAGSLDLGQGLIQLGGDGLLHVADELQRDVEGL
jgi:hypothetical protein